MEDPKDTKDALIGNINNMNYLIPRTNSKLYQRIDLIVAIISSLMK